MDEYKRSIIKSITWRFLGSVINVILFFIVTGNIVGSLSLGLVDLLVKSMLYILHERIWNKIKWGKKK